MRSARPRISWVAAIVVLSLGMTACEDDIFVILDEENDAPAILAQSPDLQGPLQIGWRDDAPALWVLAGDADGLDDIAAVFLEIQTLRFHDVIVRPNNSTTNCDSLTYVANDVVDISSLIPLGVDSPGLLIQMDLDQGGVYGATPYDLPILPDLFAGFTEASGCVSGGGSLGTYLDWVHLPSLQINAFVTLVDVEFVGMSATVYDAAGETTTTTFPDLRVVHSTSEETVFPP